MTTAQVVETSVTVNNNSPIQDYVHPDDHAQPTYVMQIILRILDSRLLWLDNPTDQQLWKSKYSAVGYCSCVMRFFVDSFIHSFNF